MCYERRRAEACVDESAHHALVNAGGREIAWLEPTQGVCCRAGLSRVCFVCLFYYCRTYYKAVRWCLIITAVPTTKLFALYAVCAWPGTPRRKVREGLSCSFPRTTKRGSSGQPQPASLRSLARPAPGTSATPVWRGRCAGSKNGIPGRVRLLFRPCQSRRALPRDDAALIYGRRAFATLAPSPPPVLSVMCQQLASRAGRCGYR